MKKMLAAFILILAFSISNAQDKGLQIGVGPALSIPTGVLQIGQGLGIGAEITAAFPISESLNIFGQTGYHSFSGKTTFGTKNPAVSFIPVIAGLRYGLKGLILGLGVGYGMYNFGEGDKESGFTFRPQMGYDLGKIEILGSYNSTSLSGANATNFAISAAYKF